LPSALRHSSFVIRHSDSLSPALRDTSAERTEIVEGGTCPTVNPIYPRSVLPDYPAP
jgi:hypothetical protein